MERMTTDSENHWAFSLNTFYAKDGQVWVRSGGNAPEYEDCTLVDFLSRAATTLGLSLDEEDPETVGEIMYDNLQFGPMESDGVLGFLWLAAGQAAEMRGLLKMVEDVLGDDYDLDRLREIVKADRDGRCVVLPCHIGDIVFMATGRVKITGYEEDICDGFYIGRNGVLQVKSQNNKGNHGTYGIIGQTAEITREAAEAALKGKQNEV